MEKLFDFIACFLMAFIVVFIFALLFSCAGSFISWHWIPLRETVFSSVGIRFILIFSIFISIAAFLKNE